MADSDQRLQELIERNNELIAANQAELAASREERAASQEALAANQAALVANREERTANREVIERNGVLIEQMEQHLRMVAEGHMSLQERLDRKLDERLLPIERSIGAIESSLKLHTDDLSTLKTDVGALKRRVDSIDEKLVRRRPRRTTRSRRR
jgi:hypothetical protein